MKAKTTRLPRMRVYAALDYAAEAVYGGEVSRLPDLLRHFNVPPIDDLSDIWVELSNRQFQDGQGVAFEFKLLEGDGVWYSEEDLYIRHVDSGKDSVWSTAYVYDKRLKRLGVNGKTWTRLWVALWYEEN